MKKLLSILSICLVFVSCSKEIVRAHEDETTRQEGKTYYDAKPLTGVRWGKWQNNNKLKYEYEYKDGIRDGFSKFWYANGNMRHSTFEKNGEYDGLNQWWHENGQLRQESVYKDGKRVSSKYWSASGLPCNGPCN